MQKNKLIRKIKLEICKRFYINTNYDPANTLLIAGTGRSGTTWLADIINYENQYRDIFEPFNPLYTKEYRTFNYKQYVRPNEKNDALKKVVDRIISGRIKNRWVDQYNRKLLCKKKIIKDIRVNLFLKWIRNNYSQLNIIFIIRNPCAVAVSRMKLGWNTHLDQILEQKQLVRDYLSPIMDRISKSSSDFERQIYLWCIENYIALRQLKEGDAIITFYEQLCVEPEAEVKRLFHKLGNEFNHKVLERIRKPSAVTGKHSAILRGDNLVSAWKRELNSDQIQIALETTKLFGLNNIYDGNLLPIKTKIKLPIKDVLSYSSK